MRDILTVLAILLVIILSAALAVPYFVDWGAQRSLIEAQLSNLLGQKVEIRGGIDLKLLPTPYLQLADVEVADPAAGADVKAAELHLEMSLTSLMRGEMDFVEARFVRPQLRLRIENGSLTLPPPRGIPAAMQFERISAEDGSLIIADPATGRTFTFDNISLDAEAHALTGPFKGDGRFEMGGEPTSFRFSTGEREGGRLGFKLIVDENKTHPRADLDASLIFAGRGLPSIMGVINLSGHLRGAVALPYQLAGTLRADLRKATISNLDLRFGDESRLASLDGTAQFDFGLKPRAEIDLKAQQIDLDKLLSADTAPPPMQKIARLLGGLARSQDLAPSGVPLSLEWSADSIFLGGEPLTDVSGDLSVSDKEAARLRFAANGPGRSHLVLDGELETGVAAGFSGRIEASADDVARLKQWLAANLPQLPRGDLPVTSFAIRGIANISGVGFVGSDLSLQVNGSKLSGTLAYTKALGPDAARLFVDLSAPALELGSLPDFSALAHETSALDLAVRLDARAVKLQGIEEGEIDAGRIGLKFDRTGRDAKLENLTVTGLDGADLAASGQWDGSLGKIAVKLDADRLDGLAGLLHRFWRGRASDFILAHAGDLSPAHLGLGAEVKIDAGRLQFDKLALSGTARQTDISGKADQDPQNAGALILSLSFVAPDSAALLHQIGVSTLPLKDIGPGSIEITARGGRRLDTTITAQLAETNFAFRGSVDPDLAAPHAAGTIKLASTDLSTLVRATALGLPDLTTMLPADLSADIDAGADGVALGNLAGTLADRKVAGHLAYSAAGITGMLDIDKLSLADLLGLALGPPQQVKAGALWSEAKFAAAEISPPPSNLEVHAASFDLGPQASGSDARFDLALAGGENGLKLGIHRFAMKIGAGSAEGDLTLRHNGANAAAEGHLRIRGYPLGLPSAGGRLDGDLDLAGTGESAAALIAGLAGSGAISVADLVLPKSDPDALARVFNAVEQDQLGIDEAEIDRVLLEEFGKHALALGKVDFDAGLAAGILRLSERNGVGTKIAPGVTAGVNGLFDIRDLSLDQESVLGLTTLPKNWTGPPPQVTLGWRGKIGDPIQTVDAAAFVNALAARAIARESARIEAQEFDVHEHAFFVARLESERRREEERLKAEDAARRAAELAKQREAETARTQQKAGAVKRNSPETAQTEAEAAAAKRKADAASRTEQKAAAVRRNPGEVSQTEQQAAAAKRNAEEASRTEQKAAEVKRRTEQSARDEIPLQIGRPTPLPPRRPTWPQPAPGTTLIPDPTAAGRY